MKADVYARQSKDRLQGIQDQIADCKALCRIRGWDVTSVITDNDVSATSSKARPGYTRLLGRIERGETDMVVVSHIDRLLRKLAELEHLIELCEKSGVKITTVLDLDLSNDAGFTGRPDPGRDRPRGDRAEERAAETRQPVRS